MQQNAAAAPSPSSPSFAGLLAALAGPAQKPTPPWSNDGLADDVAVLSYEHALRTHTRYRRAEPGAPVLPRSVDPGPITIHEAIPADAAPAASSPAPQVSSQPGASTAPETAHHRFPPPLRDLKSASITIRLSEAECTQLRTRAVESGLTISAYLRSCTFEAEGLRAQVKEALAQLRSATAEGRPALPTAARRSWVHWLARFWPRSQAGGHAARA